MNVDEVIHLIGSLYAEEPEDVCTVSVEPVIQLSQGDDLTILVPAQICESNMGIFETGANECVMNECTLDDNDNTELLPPDINTVYAPSQDEIDNTAFLTAVTRTVDVPSKDESNNIVSVPVDSCTVDIQSQKQSNYIVSVPENTSIVDEPSKDHSYIDTFKEGNACRSRKRQKDPESWKQNLKRKRRQSGKPYIDYKGNSVKARELKTKKDCQGKCRFKCSVSISESERKNIFENFWTLNDSQKFYFYRDTLERSEKERTRTRNKESRKKFSVKYFFNVGERKIRVCKEYYLSTLNISAKRITWYFENKNENGPMEDKRGKHKKKTISKRSKDIIRKHIDSFPKMSSHYCRANTNRQYLESNLTVAKMYGLYQEHCRSIKVIPEKIHIYREIFNNEFNLDFYTPKKDRCDICEEEKASKGFCVSEESKFKFEKHSISKIETKNERTRDRAKSNELIVCFDLQNVLVCPRANVSNFFYKRKLNVFNLTAHCSLNRKAYNVVWPESVAGRGANEITNALIRILSEIITEFPNKEKLILWSDSCVAQNRNSIMTYALKFFLVKNEGIKVIEQKFCEPGHSSIQEVDNIHSHLEKALAISEIYSPLSLVRVLLNVRPKYSRVIQLKNFLNYQKSSNSLNFSCIPFTKVKHIILEKAQPMTVKYRTSFQEGGLQTEVSIGKQVRNQTSFTLPMPSMVYSVPVISKEKIYDFKSMLKYMPLLDRQYFQTIIERKDHLCVVHKHSKEVQSQKKKGEGKRGHEKGESKGKGKTSQGERKHCKSVGKTLIDHRDGKKSFCQVESTGKVRPSVCTRGSQVGNSQKGLKKCKGMKTSINIEDRRSIKRKRMKQKDEGKEREKTSRKTSTCIGKKVKTDKENILNNKTDKS